LFVKDQIKIANEGGGYLTYSWTLPNSDQVSDKITYQKTYPNWGWVVSAGTYMNDFNVGSNKILITTIITLLGVLTIGSALIILFAKHISTPIKKISGIQDRSKAAVKAIEDGKIIAKEQNKSVIEAKYIFVEILKSIDKIAEDMRNPIYFYKI